MTILKVVFILHDYIFAHVSQCLFSYNKCVHTVIQIVIKISNSFIHNITQQFSSQYCQVLLVCIVGFSLVGVLPMWVFFAMMVLPGKGLLSPHPYKAWVSITLFSRIPSHVPSSGCYRVSWRRKTRESRHQG